MPLPDFIAYERDPMRVPYNYLPMQFARPEAIFRDWRRLIRTSEFTLGPFVEAFEKKFARFIGAKYVVSTNNGTDALIMSLKAVGVRPGDEVISVTNTFYATIGAIVAAGAKPVLLDCDERYQIDLNLIERAITRKTRCILPVHWPGCSPDMHALMRIARRHGLPVVEDACMAVGGSVRGRHPGTFGKVNAFSMHPLKPLNVMGDGGMVATDDERAYRWMLRYRNHGMVDRNHNDIWGVNYRLQPLQAIVASHVLDTVPEIVRIRTRNARLLDEGLQEIRPWVVTPSRPAGFQETYGLYMVLAKKRDALLRHLQKHGVEAKVHYPVPLHLQKAARVYGYRRGDCPKAEQQARELVSLPMHQYVKPRQIKYMIQCIRSFYS